VARVSRAGSARDTLAAVGPRTNPVPIRPNRLAEGFLLLLMAVGSLVLWLGIPLGGIYVASLMTDSASAHYLLALPTILAGVVALATALSWINVLYLRVSGALYREPDEDEPLRPPRGPLEALVVSTLVISILAVLAWLLLLAGDQNPPQPFPGAW
jgi:hypothetical protein